MTVVYVKVNLVEHGLGSMTRGNIKCIVLNLETLTRHDKTLRSVGGTGTNLAWCRLWIIVFSNFIQSPSIVANQSEQQELCKKTLKNCSKEEKRAWKFNLSKRERNIGSTCCRFSNVGGKSCCTFRSYKSNSATSSISRFFFKLWTREKD